MATKKYRPSFTVTQINHIIRLCETQQPKHPDTATLEAYLKTFLFKADSGLVSASHTSARKTPTMLLDELGGDTTYVAPVTNTVAKAQYWQACYEKLMQPGITMEYLTEEEQSAAIDYMYMNGLLTATQSAAYESGTLLPQLVVNSLLARLDNTDNTDHTEG